MTTEADKTEIIKMIAFIKQKVSVVSVGDRHEILKIIMKSGIEDHKLHRKGDGTQVKFKDLPYSTIGDIYKFINLKIDNKLNELQTLTDETTNEDE